MMANGTVKIEHWPHNGDCPHVVVVSNHMIKRLCMAYPTRAAAEQKMDDFALSWRELWGNQMDVLRP